MAGLVEIQYEWRDHVGGRTYGITSAGGQVVRRPEDDSPWVAAGKYSFGAAVARELRRLLAEIEARGREGR